MSNKEIERQNSAYEKAIDFYIYEGNAIWTRFNSIIVFHSILMLAIVQLTTNNTQFFFLSVGLSIIGILFSFIWLFLMERSFKFQDYWIHSARELEKMLFPSLNMLNRAEVFSLNKEVHFHLNPDPTKKYKKNDLVSLKMGVLSLFKIRWILRTTTILSILVYILILVNLLIHFKSQT